MSRLLFSLKAAVAALLLTACAGRSNCDLFTETIYQPTHAQGFAIMGASGRQSTMLVAHNPWQGAEDVSTRILVVRDGEQVPDGFDGQVLRGEARRIVAMSTTHVAMLGITGDAGRVVGVSGRGFVYNGTLRARGDSLADVGYDSNIDYELILALKPDIVLLYGVGSASPMEGKLRELGVPYAYMGEYLEQSPLGKAEWMVAMAELTGKREQAAAAFLPIVQRYDSLRTLALGCADRPRVMLNTPYGDSWVMPSTNSYVARLIADAGGCYVYGLDTGHSSLPIDAEQAYMLCSSADVWLNVGATDSMDELRRLYPRFARCRPVATGQVYNCTRRCTPSGGNDYWEGGCVRPDLVLQDMIRILHPTLLPDSALTYYKRI